MVLKNDGLDRTAQLNFGFKPKNGNFSGIFYLKQVGFSQRLTFKDYHNDSQKNLGVFL